MEKKKWLCAFGLHEDLIELCPLVCSIEPSAEIVDYECEVTGETQKAIQVETDGHILTWTRIHYFCDGWKAARSSTIALGGRGSTFKQADLEKKEKPVYKRACMMMIQEAEKYVPAPGEDNEEELKLSEQPNGLYTVHKRMELGKGSELTSMTYCVMYEGDEGSQPGEKHDWWPTRHTRFDN